MESAADIWSLGCVVAEIVNFGKAPWPVFPTVWSAILFLGEATGPLPRSYPQSLSKHCQSFMMSCFERGPHSTPDGSATLAARGGDTSTVHDHDYYPTQDRGSRCQ